MNKGKKIGHICLASTIVITQVSTLDALSSTAYAIEDNQELKLLLQAEKNKAQVDEEIVLKIIGLENNGDKVEIVVPEGMQFDEEATKVLNERNGSRETIRLIENSVIQIEKTSQNKVLGIVRLAVKGKQPGAYKFETKLKQGDQEVNSTVIPVVHVTEKAVVSVGNTEEKKSDIGHLNDKEEKNEKSVEINEVHNEDTKLKEVNVEKSKDDDLKQKETTQEETEKNVDSEKKYVEEVETEAIVSNETTPVEHVEERPDNQEVKHAVVNGEVDVYDDKTFREALNDKNVSKINIMANFTVNHPAYGFIYFPVRPDLVIEGNGHTVDFRGLCGIFTATVANKMNLTIQNINILGSNYYGPFRMDAPKNSNSAFIKYENLSYIGPQLTCSYNADVIFAGKLNIQSVGKYTSLDGQSIPTTGTDTQQNVEATNVKFLEGTHYIGSTKKSAVFGLFNGGTVDVGKDAIIDVSASDTGGENPQAVIVTQGQFIIHDGAKVNVSTTSTSNRGGIRVEGTNSGITVEKNAELNINTKGVLGYNALYLGPSANLKVADSAKLTVKSENTANSTQASVYAGNGSSFVIGKKSTFDVHSDGTGSKNLIYIGTNAKFQFANAERVNLALDNSHASSRLIYMYGVSGVLDVDVQRVKAWKNGVSINDDNNPSYTWNPMYGMHIKYTYADVKEALGNSLTEKVQNDFRENFRTQNFKRVLFEYIPDVSVSIDELTDNQNKDNSHVITGVTNPGALVRLSGDDAIPSPTIDSSDVNISEKYHVVADSEGKYSFTLPKGKYLTAGNTVKAFSYLSGKYDEASTIVKDETAPEKPILEEPIKDISEKFQGKAEPNSVVHIYSEDGDVLIGTVKADANGVYTLVIPEEKKPLIPGTKYYATATDTAGNISERSDRVTVKDTIAPTASPVTQVINIGDQLSDNPKEYVTNVNDNAGTSDSNLSYKITKKPDVSKIGYVEAEVTITDAAGNTTKVSVPVFVKDDRITIGNEAALQARDFVSVVDDVPADAEQLKQYILKEAEVKAWELPGGADVTNEVQITDIGGLTNQIGDYTVTLKVKDVERKIKVSVIGGNLELIDVPQSISFGNVKVQSKEKIFNRSGMKGKLIVSDKRKDKTEWQVYVKQTSPLMNTDNDVLPDAIVYSANGINTVLNEQSYLVTTHTSTNNEDVSFDWKDDEGVRLRVTSGPNVKVNKSYKGELEWTLTNAPI
ncbi:MULTISPECIES: pectate lyase-like adhesive domain-containing protein [Bacillus]|uniref:pectate lyase-like adhesive domain-containing protein n=1 Tax=Bacillus TaxID=1386 RepID=UPI000A83FC36|nr:MULTISPECIES: pectate lyase-like adhesive domain-containing protein [Bacillus cereus group]MCU5057049.1 Ig-like domain-containing protein [Bacillus cereus]USL03340.1 Ig-like domain-containing protein [Bacillus anthracis]